MAFDTVRVTRLETRPKVAEQFPVVDAVNVDAAAMPMVLFSTPMDLASLSSAFRLESGAGAAVSGILRLDRDVLTFAPAALLAPGERYTIRIAPTARSISGDALESGLATTFTVAASSGPAAPTLGPIVSSCAETVSISGNAPANARLRINLGSLSFNASASSSGLWSYQLPVAGYAGHQVVRVRIIGSDGSLSPAAEACFLIDCAGPRVVSANYDRSTNRITIAFSREIAPSTATTDSIVVRADGRAVGTAIVVDGAIVTANPSEDLTRRTVTLGVTTAIADRAGGHLSLPYTATFTFEVDAPPAPGDGSGFMSGEVFDAESGRPLGGASVFVDVATSPLLTDARGRYAARLPEGAHTIRVTADGYTTVWRQVIIPAGAGVIPIDMRLTPTGLGSPARMPASEGAVEYTRIDGQSLPGLLPLGWSPLVAAAVDRTGELVLEVPAEAIIAAAQVLTAVRYRDDRDEWRVLIAAANVVDGKVTVPIDEPGSYALVYPDNAPQLARPPTPLAGAALAGTPDACATQPCGELVAESFVLHPPLVLPSGRTLATLKIAGAPPANFPSGTAVQAYVDEELHLSDGSRVTDPPFATDLLLYRDLRGRAGVAEFRLGPSSRAAEVILEVGFNHIRILPYPGRLDRGSLIGVEGGRVPGDGRVTLEIPAGAAPEAIRATSAAISDFEPFGAIPGFTIVGGFTLTLELARQIDQPDGLPFAAPELLQAARVTFAPAGTGQHILVEVRDGPRFRLAAQMDSIGGSRLITRVVDRSVLPLDGVIREGRYLLLKADAPISFATGTLRDASNTHLRDARVSAPPLGVSDSTRSAGTYAVPVPAGPAAPFTLVPSSSRTGDGVPYHHPTSPAPDSVVPVDLTLQTTPLRLLSTEPGAGAVGVGLTPFVRAHFDADLDPRSVNQTSIVVVESGTQTTVDAEVLLDSPRTVLWRLRGGVERLVPNRAYTVNIAPGIRKREGTPFGRTHTFGFETLAEVTSTSVHPEKIRITIPDTNGRSRVIGAAGAVPQGFVAVVTRRGRDFSTPFQATAAGDGGFVIAIDEAVALMDLIDLQVLNTAGAIAAVIPLTPFSAEDGKGFIATPDRMTRFVTADGLGVTVPAGAFDGPTLIEVLPAQGSAFAAVPGFASELSFAAGLSLRFEGVAHKRLEIEVPVPSGADSTRSYYLGHLVESIRGPRVMIVDLLRIADGRFMTSDDGRGAQRSSAFNEVLTGREARGFLLGVDRSGDYAALSFSDAVAWAFIEGVSAVADFFFDTMQSIFAASYYMVERGRILVPVAADKPFKIIGVDVSTGVTAFETPYGAIPPGDTGATTTIASPVPNELGPYPIFATPARVEVVDLSFRHDEDESIRNLRIRFDGVRLTVTSSSDPLEQSTTVEMLNLRSGDRVADHDFAASDGLALPAIKGDRILLFIEELNSDPESIISVVFSEPVAGDAQSLASSFVLSAADQAAVPRVFATITDQVTLVVDPSGRRVDLQLPSSLQRGKAFRLSVLPSITERQSGAETPLRLAQPKGGRPLADAIHFEFETRGPRGEVGSFDLPRGGVRDLALAGNLLLVSALDGGIFAYDASNPASLSAPVTGVDAPPGGENWAVAADHHGRIYATALSSTFGVVRSYRVEDFVAAAEGTSPRAPAQKANAIVSWRPGINVGLPLSTSNITVSDRPEAIPRKIRLVTQDEDDPLTYIGIEALRNAYQGSDLIDLGGGFAKTALTIRGRTGFPYLVQRVTVINETGRFRWSADVPRDTSKTLTVVGRLTDRFKVVRNLTTFGVINLFGYGVGIFDLNAIEANGIVPGQEGHDPSYKPIAERVLITRAEVKPACDPTPTAGAACNPSVAADSGVHCPIENLALSPESALLATPTGALVVYALDANRGLLELRVTPPGQTEGDEVRPASCERSNQVVLSERIILNGQFRQFAHPRLNRLRRLYRERAGRDPFGRFTSIATHRDPVSGTQFGLIAGFEFGVAVVELDPSSGLSDQSLASVIWIPSGAQSVRVLEGQKLATIVDAKGRVLLVDLSNLDERGQVPREPALCTHVDCEWDLFPIVSGALGPHTFARDGEVGADDPRIVWKSAYDPANPSVVGTMPPLVDAETGFVFTGDVNSRRLRAVSAVDPQLRIVGDSGLAGGEMRELKTVVPLGLAPPLGAVGAGANASLGAFRIESSLPGGLSEALPGGRFEVAVISERVFGAPTPQSPQGLPRSHLRDLPLSHAVPASADPDVRALRYQRGWNLFSSPWIVALADPRAAKDYVWPTGTTGQEKEREGCHACDRPQALRNDPSAVELYSAGRLFAISPEPGTFSGTPYEYLVLQGRLTARVTTTPADTLRPASVDVAAMNPPVASGALQETYYVHSGELETGNADLITLGRAGVDVVVDRTYRSRTLGGTGFGSGWDSRLFQRIRPLPNGNVEYRDGVGNVWSFAKGQGHSYTPPPGLYLKLTATDGGWNLIDPLWQLTRFDRFGRIASFADRFQGTDDDSTGNRIHYLYDSRGRLASVVDPLGRASIVRHWEDADAGSPGAYSGLIREIRDWRGREVDFEYDADGRLVRVRLPEVTGEPSLGSDYTFTGVRRPRIEYAYDQGAYASLNDKVELRSNLISIKEPVAAMTPGGLPRVTFGYDPSHRDRIKSEKSALPECSDNCGVVTFTYPDDRTTKVVDLLGQERTYDLTPPTLHDRRMHVAKVTEHRVSVVVAASVDLFARDRTLISEESAVEDLATRFEFDGQGQIKRIDHPNGLVTTYSYLPRSQGAAREVIGAVEQRSPGGTSIITSYTYDSFLRTQNIARTVGRRDTAPAGGAEMVRTIPVPRVDGGMTTKVTDDDTEVVTEHDGFGRTTLTSRTAPGGTGDASTNRFHYHDNGPDLSRGRLAGIKSGESEADGGTSFRVEYATSTGQGEKIITRDVARQIEWVALHDSYGRLVARTVKGVSAETLTDEKFGYDAEGRLRLHVRKQNGADVRTTVDYDIAGRVIGTSLENAQVDGAPAVVKTASEHDVGTRTSTDYAPFTTTRGHFTLTRTDPLGRPEHIEQAGGGERVEARFGYDRAGHRVFQTDQIRTASVQQFDAFGRPTLALRSDGTRSRQTWDAWNQLTLHEEWSARGPSGEGPERVAETGFLYTREGRQRGVGERVIGAAVRATRSDLSVNGRTEITRVGKTPLMASELDPNAPLRTRRVLADTAGRVVSDLYGEGTFPLVASNATFSRTTVSAFAGAVPLSTATEEPIAGARYSTSTVMDALGRIRELHEADGAYRSTVTYDEAGNPIASLPAGHREPWTRQYDSRGLLVEEKAPEGKVVQRDYDALGNLRRYRDEASTETIYETDGLGRVRKTIYADGTSEEVVFEQGTGQIAARRNRSGVWRSFFYAAGGRLSEERFGLREAAPATTPSGEPARKYTYDLAGRLREIRTKDAAIQYDEHDLLGRPAVSRSLRFKNASGFAASPEVLDAHTQKTVWSIFDGERERYRLPAAGMSVPATEDPASPWRNWIVEERDAGGNVVSQRTAEGVTITTANGRGMGRLTSRLRFFGIAGHAYDEVFDYADGEGVERAAPGPPSGVLGRSRVEFAGVAAGGSEVVRDGSRRVAVARELGLATRRSEFAYDDRGRLETSSLLRVEDSGSRVEETLVHADFRQGRRMTADPNDLEELGDAAEQVAPPSWTATKNDVHQITSITVSNETGPRAYTFEGGRRTSDGRWTAAYDDEDRLISMSRGDQRITYTYNPLGRIVGRKAENIQDDALPSDSTWVWDVADRLVAIYETGKSLEAGAGPEAGLVRQYLHGDQGYDDPIEISIRQSVGSVRRYLPLIDYAGGGSVDAVLNGSTGKLAERFLYADAYGDAPRHLYGPVVDQISIEVRKSGAGTVAEAKVRVRLSEAIDASTVADGVRLAAVKPDGTPAATTAASPTLEDQYTIVWTLGPVEWALLTTAPAATQIEIAVTDDLRGALWDGPVMPLAPWLANGAGRGSTPAAPVMQRESLGSLLAFSEEIAPGQSEARTLLEIADLYLVASVKSKTEVMTGFKAAPFVEPGTGLAHLRVRWYEPASGTWVTADPESYADGSNRYGGLKSDPVNHSDPKGSVALVDNLIGCGASTLIGWGITEAIGDDYTLKDAGVDCALGFATSGLSSLGHLRHGSRLVRWGARVGAEAALDIGAEVSRREWKDEDYTWNELASGAAANALIGESGAFIGRKFAQRFSAMRALLSAPRPGRRRNNANFVAADLDSQRYEPNVESSGQGLLLPVAGVRNPWRDVPSYVGPAPRGLEIEMALSPGQVNPGGFGTTDVVPDLAFIRGDLAVIPSFKQEISHVQRYLVPTGIQVQIGTIGPQIEDGIYFPGGRLQVQIMNFDDRARLIPLGAPRPIGPPRRAK